MLQLREGSCTVELLLLPPEALELGDLPLAEVRQGQEEWNKLTAEAAKEMKPS